MSAGKVIAVLLLSAGLLPVSAAAREAAAPQLAQNEAQTQPLSETESFNFQPLNSGEGGNRGITRGERETVQNYVNGGRGSIAAWQSSLERLPPGVEDELQPGADLPPGVQMHGLPNSLEGALPPRRDEAWAVSGYNLLLIDRESGKIVDVWRKVFEPY